jgi:hypothetical protein
VETQDPDAFSAEHIKDLAISVRRDICGLETARKNTVELKSSALPRSAQPIAKSKLQFRPVEGALSGLDVI